MSISHLTIYAIILLIFAAPLILAVAVVRWLKCKKQS
jgi:hypothetical protein